MKPDSTKYTYTVSIKELMEKFGIDLKEQKLVNIGFTHKYRTNEIPDSIRIVTEAK